MGTKQSVQQMVLGQLDVPYKGIKLNYHPLYIQMNSKWINSLNIKIKILEENRRNVDKCSVSPLWWWFLKYDAKI